MLKTAWYFCGNHDTLFQDSSINSFIYVMKSLLQLFINLMHHCWKKGLLYFKMIIINNNNTKSFWPQLISGFV